MHRSAVVSVLSAADGRLLSKVESAQALLRCVWSPGGRRLVTGDMAGTAAFWDAATGEQVVTFTGHRAYVMGVTFSPDGSVLGSASGDGDVRLWRAKAQGWGGPED